MKNFHWTDKSLINEPKYINTINPDIDIEALLSGLLGSYQNGFFTGIVIALVGDDENTGYGGAIGEIRPQTMCGLLDKLKEKVALSD